MQDTLNGRFGARVVLFNEKRSNTYTRYVAVSIAGEKTAIARKSDSEWRALLVSRRGWSTVQMNMFKPVGAKTREEYIEILEPERRKLIEFLDDFIQKAAPSLKPVFSYNMLGYGNFKYKNYKKEVIDWPTIALASQKNYVSVYVCAVVDGEYIAETHKDGLGKVSVGKSCIRFKKLNDVNLPMLKKVIQMAEKNPGFEGLK